MPYTGSFMVSSPVPAPGQVPRSVFFNMQKRITVKMKNNTWRSLCLFVCVCVIIYLNFDFSNVLLHLKCIFLSSHADSDWLCSHSITSSYELYMKEWGYVTLSFCYHWCLCALMLQHTGTLQLHLHHHCSKWLGTLHAYMVVCKGTPLIMIRGKIREALNFSPHSVHHHRCNILPLKMYVVKCVPIQNTAQQRWDIRGLKRKRAKTII